MHEWMNDSLEENLSVSIQKYPPDICILSGVWLLTKPFIFSPGISIFTKHAKAFTTYDIYVTCLLHKIADKKKAS